MKLNFIVWDGSNSSEPLNLNIETGSDHPPIAGQIFHWPAAGYFLIVDVPEPHIVIAKNVGFWSGPPILTKDGNTHLWRHGPMTETFEAINCLGCLYTINSEKMRTDKLTVNRGRKPKSHL
jgi:hypothetical protein